MVLENKSKRPTKDDDETTVTDYEAIKPNVPTKTDGANVLYESTRESANAGKSESAYAEVSPKEKTGSDYAEITAKER